MPGLQDAAIQAAETLQTASINRSPNVERDINPSTTASTREPVRFDRSPSTDAISDAEDADEDEVPLSVLRPTPRKPTLPPLPDLRFEQSYMASIKDAQSWQMVTYITMRDQVMMPLVQGMVWTLAVSGWRYFNRDTQLKGQTVGAKIRRWWYGVNNWPLPNQGTLRDEKLAGEAAEFFQGEFASAGSD